MNTEYYITPVPFLPFQCPVFVSRKYGQSTIVEAEEFFEMLNFCSKLRQLGS
jgi:hypothetical protein